MRNWLPVGRADHVANPADFLTATRFRGPILVVRDKEDRLHGLSNVRLHPNFPVA